MRKFYLFASIIAPMAASGFASSLMPNSMLFDLYDTLKVVHTQQGAIPEELYAATLTALSPAMQGMSLKNPIVRAVTAQYVEEGLTPAQLIMDIDSGKAAERAIDIELQLHEMRKSKKHAGVQPTSSETPNPSDLIAAESQGTVVPRLERAVGA